MKKSPYLLPEGNMIKKTQYRGVSHTKRVKEVNDIYDQHLRSGLSNREIWRRYIWPIYGISEATLYSYLKQAFNTIEANS